MREPILVPGIPSSYVEKISNEEACHHHPLRFTHFHSFAFFEKPIQGNIFIGRELVLSFCGHSTSVSILDWIALSCCECGKC